MIAVGDRRDPGGRPRAEARQPGGEVRPGKPVGFGEEQVQPDRGRPRLADPVDEVGEELPGPGPLAMTREAQLVHGHDDRRPRDPDSRRQALAEVEPEPPQPGVGPAQTSRPTRTRSASAQTARPRAHPRRAPRQEPRALALRARAGPRPAGRALSRHAPRGGASRPSDPELETVVRGRDAQGALTPGQLLEALRLAPDGRQPLVVVGRLVMEEAQVPDARPSGRARRRRRCSSGPSPP